MLKERWEFVGVEAPGRCPTWDEMAWVKEQLWEPEDVVIQIHPSQSRYVNSSEFTLWLWRPIHCEIPQPGLWRERLIASP